MGRSGFAVAWVVLLAAAGGAKAAEPWRVMDIVGDANGLNAVQNTEVDTRPASIAPADIRMVEVRTTHVAAPVGEDGIDYRETGIEISFTTEAPPAADAADLLFKLATRVADCDSSFGAFLAPLGLPKPDPVWVQFGPTCPDAISGAVGTARHFAWPVSVDASTRRVSITIPFATLPPAHADVLKPGAVLEAPVAETHAGVAGGSTPGFFAFPILVDATRPAPNFVIGSDVPADVPCTRGCPTE